MIYHRKMKVTKKKLTEQEQILTLDALYTAAGTVRGRAAMKSFLRDLLTESERFMLGRRILIARELINKTRQAEIVDRYHVGYDTIQKVEHWLSDQFPGYEQAIAAMETEMAKRNKKRTYPSRLEPIAWLKKKYPLHFLLFPSK